MPHDPEKYLYDACQAAKLITRFIENKSFADYLSDLLLQSGVERQLIIAGEALNKLSKVSLQNVWFLKEVPQDVKAYLNLPDRDEGIDLIAQTFDMTITGLIDYLTSKHKSVKL